MKQLSPLQSIINHLYPGIIITIAFIILSPLVIANGYPPQFALLLCIAIVAIPALTIHLVIVKREEKLGSILQINGYNNKLSTGKLVLYSVGLVVLAFLIWGATQPLTAFITNNIFHWLPSWFTTQDFAGYDADKIRLTLILNLVLNGIAAPFLEELYFRGYLMPRMKSWGNAAFLVNAILFSLYHFWQPYIYITLILSLLPMTYVVWKTQDLRVGILTHCLLNLIGALATFGMLMR